MAVRRLTLGMVAACVLCGLAPGLARAATPTVVVSPTSGAPGRGLTVSGGGWPSGASVFVQIGSTTFDTDVACVLGASSDGTIAGTKANGNCQVPNVPAGSRTLVAIDEQSQSVKATGASFTVTSTLTLTPGGAAAGAPASPGATVTIQGAGFAASGSVSSFKFDTAALTASPASIGTDANGSFVSGVTFTVPSTATAGNHTVSGSDGTHTGSATVRIYKPTVTVSPASGAPGRGLTVSGGGWPAGDEVFVQIGSTTFDSNVVCVLGASSDGTIEGTSGTGNCHLPNVAVGSRTLFAIDEQNQGVHATGAAFNVTPGLTLTPGGASAGAPASPGATVTIQGAGFAAAGSVSGFKFDTAALTTSPTTINTDGNGTFAGGVTFTVPSTATGGNHTVSASDGTHTATATLRIYKPSIRVTPTSGAPGRGLTVSGGGWPVGDEVFVQIGSTTFDADVVCVLTASSDGTIGGNQNTGNCTVPKVPAGSRTLFTIDEQNEGVSVTGTAFTLVPGLTLTPSGASVGTPASPGATVTMQGAGFAAAGSVSSFKFDTAALTTSPTSISTDGSGSFTSGVTFTVPSATTGGNHTVSASDGTHTATATVRIYRPSIRVTPSAGAPGRGLTVSGGGWPAGDEVFVQIGSTTFDTDVACVLTASSDGTIGGNQANGSCQVPSVPVATQPLVAIDEQNEGVRATGANFTVN